MESQVLADFEVGLVRPAAQQLTIWRNELIKHSNNIENSLNPMLHNAPTQSKGEKIAIEISKAKKQMHILAYQRAFLRNKHPELAKMRIHF